MFFQKPLRPGNWYDFLPAKREGVFMPIRSPLRNRLINLRQTDGFSRFHPAPNQLQGVYHPLRLHTLQHGCLPIAVNQRTPFPSIRFVGQDNTKHQPHRNPGLALLGGYQCLVYQLLKRNNVRLYPLEIFLLIRYISNRRTGINSGRYFTFASRTSNERIMRSASSTAPPFFTVNEHSNETSSRPVTQK